MSLITNINQLAYYLQAFWSVVVMSCIQPINWEYCLPVDTWLLPALEEAWVIKTDPNFLYRNEREYLDRIKLIDNISNVEH